MSKTTPLSWKTIRVPLGNLIPWDKNPVKISPDALKRLAAQLKRGQDLPYVAAAPPNGHKEIPLLDGHQRKRAETEVNQASPKTLVPVLVPSRKMTEAERKQWVIEHRANTGVFDGDVLLEWYEADNLLDWGIPQKELESFGFEFEGEGSDAEPQIDRAAELLKKWKVKSGDLWQIGEHRLICGDCTDAAVVARVMDGERADCVWTDPPYGVEYVGKTKNALTIENDGADGLPKLLEGCYSCADGCLVDGAPIYVAHPPGALQFVFGKAFLDVGWKFHEEIVWVKDSMVLGHSDYHLKHEGIHYGWKGSNRFWYGGRDQVSTLPIDRPKRSEEHPTMKPVELVDRCLANSTQSGDIVYEPFSGSGTTLVACQNLRRRCRAVEISPAYCAVALQRMADAFPGIEIKRLK